MYEYVSYMVTLTHDYFLSQNTHPYKSVDLLVFFTIKINTKVGKEYRFIIVYYKYSIEDFLILKPLIILHIVF